MAVYSLAIKALAKTGFKSLALLIQGMNQLFSEVTKLIILGL
jgi:hypothetical protein